jgi:deoxyadenosine/deoxycytidine kinase
MYIVEGNIGVGKSTFLKLINQHLPKINVSTEPLSNWAKQIYGQSLLENFYKDPKRWAFTLETLAMICRAKDHTHEQENNNPNTLMERSIYSGHYCFSINGYENGYFTQIEWGIYNKWADFLLHQKCQPPHGFIYLKADPSTCFDRVKKRNRLSEKNLTLAYLKLIDQKHEKFLIQKDGVYEKLKNIPVLVLDCNQEFEQNEANMQKHVYKVKTFLQGTQNTQTTILPTQSEKTQIL